MTALTTVLLVGGHGYGVRHLENLERLRARVELVGVVDPKGAPSHPFGRDAPCWPSLAEAFDAGVRPDVAIIATPTGTHFPLAALALEHGCDLFLEKPPVASMRQFDRLLALQAASGRAVQIGFQSFGSAAVEHLRTLGRPTSVATWASWTRDHGYWSRSSWAGKRGTDEHPIVDGVATNALSHAIATALRIAGARTRDDVARVEVELLRGNDIEADDTSALRVTLSSGRIVSAGLTLCGAAETTPVIEVRTPQADAEFWYTADQVRVGLEERTFERIDLFEELLDHRCDGRPLSAALADTGAFMEVLEAIRLHEPLPIDAQHLETVGSGPSARIVVEDVADWCARAARAGALFSELRAPWAPPPTHPSDLHRVSVEGAAGSVAVRDEGTTVARTSSPRPHLHPVRTLGGVAVTDAHPEDHDWHLGINIGIQHVNGVNFWGGRTYAPEGYRWLDDHGTCRTRHLAAHDHGFRAEVDWVAPDGGVLLRDAREFTARARPDAGAWTFSLDWHATAPSIDVSLGSPGSAGRSNAGYGGLNWRLPLVAHANISSGTRHGEDAVHGLDAHAPLIISGEFPEGPATIALCAADADTELDPWFVRAAAFPSIGSALAWDTEVHIPAGGTITRRFVGLVADGILSARQVESILRAATR